MASAVVDKRKTYQRIARLYDLLDLPFEYGHYRRLRKELAKGLSGKILDAGVGTGRNFPFYPDGAVVTGIDLSPAMLGRAEKRRRKHGQRVELVEMDVRQTAFADNSFDMILSTFLFCVLEPEDQMPALVELGRICRPGGDIRILEYSLSKNRMLRGAMKILASWVYFAYGATFDRNTEQYLEGAGLELVEKRFLYLDIIKMLIARPK